MSLAHQSNVIAQAANARRRRLLGDHSDPNPWQTAVATASPGAEQDPVHAHDYACHSPSPLALTYTRLALETAPIRSLLVKPRPKRVLFCDVSSMASMKNAVTRKLSLALVARAVTRLATGVGKIVGASATAPLDACSTSWPAISLAIVDVVTAAPLPMPFAEVEEGLLGTSSFSVDSLSSS